MTLQGLLLVILTAACTAVANLLMKSGIARTGVFSLSLAEFNLLGRQPAFVTGLLLVGLAGVMWFKILSIEKVTTCYPLFVGLTYVFLSLGAVYFLSERLSFQNALGVGVIVLGMAIVALRS